MHGDVMHRECAVARNHHDAVAHAFAVLRDRHGGKCQIGIAKRFTERLPDGQPVVVDYKKSSSGTRRQRLNKGFDLQVDLYRRMDVRVSEKSSEGVLRIAATLTAWNGLPAVAYHTLNDGAVLGLAVFSWLLKERTP